MRGRSSYRGSNHTSDGNGGDSSELSAMFSGDNHHKQRRVPLQRTTSLKLPNKQLYTVKENSHEEPAIPSTNVSYHASKLMANRQRSSAASLLYTNVKNKRNSSNFSLKDMRNNSAASSSHGSDSSSSRPALNVVIQDSKNNTTDALPPSTTTNHNPLNHYRFVRNMATRPKSTGTAYLPADDTESITSLNVELRPRFDKNNANALASQGSAQLLNLVQTKSSDHLSQVGKDATLEDAETIGDFNGTSFDKEVTGENAFLETQIENAMSEELFSKDYVFDNCFDDIIQEATAAGNDKLRSVASSNQSPLTRVPARKLSKTDSATLKNFQNDLSSRSSAGSQDTAYTSRLQMKMETMKNRFDSFATNNESLYTSGNSTANLRTNSGSHESEKSILLTVPNVSKSMIDIYREKNDAAVAGDPTVQFSRFWFHHDLSSKLLTEERSNQLRTIERFSSSGAAGEKVLTSRLKFLSREGYLMAVSDDKKAQLIRRKETNAKPPVLRAVNEPENSRFEQLFFSTRNNLSSAKNADSGLDPETVYLREQVVFGKMIFDKIWREAEQNEHRQLSHSIFNAQTPKSETSPTTKVYEQMVPSHSDQVSNAHMPLGAPPELIRQASH
ncbi:uncharacterized protein LALA0_S01e01882g [Lachancea lanzarotensis]|uniref:LALA0S01e01882g1_1 n=1 Tax=Lachancea lanzarotensis TaxID=1245769 RepID=A0A0C7N3K8_9SACH|nr:uncharacterized protein LALA0_S01e01882g [Lachancea lanzarotensis]CEP60051.1 LALA0S01e01882g1_1 [Lachancea lanzarotensis]